MKMNKKDYIVPQIEVVNLDTNNLLIASKENYGEGADADAPPMMNMPDEDMPTEYED